MHNTDEQARHDALNPEQSFIVQAPAGSGKTELLTRRFLSLLGQACEAPEQIIAITFTRKAAAEMRERIITALNNAAHQEGISGQLAQEALRKDQFYRWRLLENPQRLQILTIDALCSQLRNRLPLLAGHGASMQIVEDANPYYQRAVREIMTQATPLELLAHLDNNTELLMRLCVELLARREQWLPYLAGGSPTAELRQQLEQGLAQLAEEILSAANQRLDYLKAKLLPLLLFAGKNLQARQSSHLLTQWIHRSSFPSPTPAELESWRALAQSLLTTQGEWRKTIDIRTGFPPKTEEKIAFENILEELTGDDATQACLRQILQCPPIHYSDAQWHIIGTLIQTLPLLAAQLQVIFQQHGVMDFVELGLSASRALGEEQQPTDLALSLDYRIRHLLVDEFQDTSVSQFKLLEKLLLGWEPGDGRSVFLVGDPMQSIYRFRNAEVGLFLRAIHSGIQQISLTPLTLTRNFRSGEHLIRWINQIFPQIFPAAADLTHGAIPYTAATPTQPQMMAPEVSCYSCYDANNEAQQVIKIIRECRHKHSNAKIAILVRSRPHLLEIVSALQTAQIKFQAVEIEPLATRAEIQDLTALTRALLHHADRIAWLAVLRAPYCGLTLADLHVIAQASEHRTIFEVLINFQQLNSLSLEGKERLQRVVPVLANAQYNRGRQSLTTWIEGAWLTLGGPAGLKHRHELLNTQVYFKLLISLEQEEQNLNSHLIQQRLEKLYAEPDTEADGSLQIMTIHKAKGLEFDHVILPELNRKPTVDGSKLLLWLERAISSGGSHLILAPIKEAAADSDPMYVYLKQVEQQKLRYESERLLYVATTRAKQTLHLLAVLPNVLQIKEWQPPAGSFLQMLWPYFRDQLPDSPAPVVTQAITENSRAQNFHRLKSDWQLPPLPNGRELIIESAIFSPAKPIDIELPDKHAAKIGTVIHEALAHLAEHAPHFPDFLNNTHWERRLRQLGITDINLDASVRKLQNALKNTLEDPRGNWILSAAHQDPKNEYSLSTCDGQQVSQVILDRTFIDNTGVRWIIDYKTAPFSEDALPTYHSQLTHYAQIMALQDSRPIRLAVYFPLSSTWREWEYSQIKNEQPNS